MDYLKAMVERGILDNPEASTLLLEQAAKRLTDDTIFRIYKSIQCEKVCHALLDVLMCETKEPNASSVAREAVPAHPNWFFVRRCFRRTVSAC